MCKFTGVLRLHPKPNELNRLEAIILSGRYIVSASTPYYGDAYGHTIIVYKLSMVYFNSKLFVQINQQHYIGDITNKKHGRSGGKRIVFEWEIFDKIKGVL